MKTTHLIDMGSHRSGSLYQLVEDSIKKYLPIALDNSNSLINNVNNKLSIYANETIVGSVIGGLLHAVITHVKESHIYISAKLLYGKMIEINVKDDNCYNSYALALSLQNVVPIAEKIGGKLNITNQRQKITTISFTFPAGEGETGIADYGRSTDFLMSTRLFNSVPSGIYRIH